MRLNTVSFPGLGITLNINPVAFNVFGKDIYWYGIIIALGFLLAVIFGYYEANRTGIDPECLSDFLIWATPAAIIGARLYYVVFSWDYYSKHPGEIIAIWNGGIAIYGAIIAAVITVIIYCNITKVDLWKLVDIGAMGLLIGQSIGRWGNFVNKEAYGYATNLPWRMEIYSSAEDRFISVHPTFLYESLWNAVGFAALLFLRKRKPFDGFVFWCYLVWYGLGRMWIEGLRTDSLYLGPVRVSQLVALICIIAGVSALWFGFKRLRAFKEAPESTGDIREPEAEESHPVEDKGLEDNPHDSAQDNEDTEEEK